MKFTAINDKAEELLNPVDTLEFSPLGTRRDSRFLSRVAIKPAVTEHNLQWKNFSTSRCGILVFAAARARRWSRLASEPWKIGGEGWVGGRWRIGRRIKGLSRVYAASSA